MGSNFLNQAKETAFALIKNSREDNHWFDIFNHITEVERWAKWMLKKYPQADADILLAAVYWHDVGQYVGNEDDHAINSAEAAEDYLKNTNLSVNQQKAIIHCVRAHRCKDVQPQSLEAKLMAWCDSASHFTSNVYWLMTRYDLENNTAQDDLRAIDKIARDWRDLDLFPTEKKTLDKLYLSWQQLIETYIETTRKRKDES